MLYYKKMSKEKSKQYEFQMFLMLEIQANFFKIFIMLFPFYIVVNIYKIIVISTLCDYVSINQSLIV